MDDLDLKNQGRVFLEKHEDHTVSQLTKVTSNWYKMRIFMVLVIFLSRKDRKYVIRKQMETFAV